MACFIVPLTQAIATTAYRKSVEKKQSLTNSVLVVDHIINGEVTWMYPFFTALETEGGWQTMLSEMLTVGVPMSVIVTAVWAVYCYAVEKKAVKA